MSNWVNVGAKINGQRPASKAALRRALADDPASVLFDTTSMFGPRAGDVIMATAADIGVHALQVTGPDPYTDRRWYGTVQVKSGVIRLS